MCPSGLLVDSTDLIKELILTLEHTMQIDTCVAIVSKQISDTPPLAKVKKSILDNQTAIVEHLEEYFQVAGQVAEVMDEPDMSEDNIGQNFVAFLKVIWRLKALNVNELLSGVREEVEKTIKSYVAMVLDFATKNAVPVTYCNSSSAVLAEATLTFTESTILLDLRERVAGQIQHARAKGIGDRIKTSHLDFLKDKTKENFACIVSSLNEAHGVKLDDCSLVLKAVYVFMEDIAKQFPSPSTYGDKVPEVMVSLCTRFLEAHVFISRVFNMFTFLMLRVRTV